VRGHAPPALDHLLGGAQHRRAADRDGARSAVAPPGAEQVAAALARAGLPRDEDALETAVELVRAWARSPLRQTLAGDGARVRPEAPFVIELAGTPVRGTIDLLAESDTGVLVVDYKTDSLTGRSPAEAAAEYATQRDLYALVAWTGAAADGAELTTAYCFLEAPEDPVIESYDEARVEAARARLIGLVASLREGGYEPAAEPTRALCFGCPAAERLCPRAAWHPSHG